MSTWPDQDKRFPQPGLTRTVPSHGNSSPWHVWWTLVLTIENWQLREENLDNCMQWLTDREWHQPSQHTQALITVWSYQIRERKDKAFQKRGKCNSEYNFGKKSPISFIATNSEHPKKISCTRGGGDDPSLWWVTSWAGSLGGRISAPLVTGNQD